MGVDTREKRKEASELALEMLRQALPEAILETASPQGDATAVILPEHLIPAMEFLKTEPALKYDMLADITAVDHLPRQPRFDLVYNLVSVSRRCRLRVKVRVDEGHAPIRSLSSVYASANWLEREVWDMFGIRFAGHPNLKRILLYEEFEGHPLRKDYPIRRRQPLIGPRN